MAHVKVTPEVVKWAMNAAAIDVESLSTATGLNAGTLEDILEGQSEPTKGQLDKIAKATRRPWQFFLLPYPPAASFESLPSFRGRLHESNSEAKVQANAVRQARRLQKTSVWVGDTEQATIPINTLETAPAAAAHELRSFLGWTTKTQRKLSKTGVFKELRSRIELSDVIVLLMNAGGLACRGFSLHGEARLIYVNSAYKGGAIRAFTLIHELAHLTLGASDVLCDYGTSPEERWANAVAAEFLAPMAEVKLYVAEANLGSATPDDLETVRRVSQYFKISWLAAAIRLRQLGLSDEATVDKVRDNPVLDEESGFLPGGRNTAEVRASEYGQRLPRQLFRALDEGRMPRHEVARLFHTDTRQLEQLRALVGAE